MTTPYVPPEGDAVLLEMTGTPGYTPDQGDNEILDFSTSITPDPIRYPFQFELAS